MAHKRHYGLLLALAVAATVGVWTDAVAKPKHRVHRARPAAARVMSVAPPHALSIFAIIPFGVMCMRATRAGSLVRKIGFKSFKIV